MTGVRYVLIGVLGLGLLASAYVAFERGRVESRNRTVGLVVDYDEVERLALLSGVPATDVLRELKSAGATGVALAEDTLHGLLRDGRLEMGYTAQPSVVSHYQALAVQVAEQVYGRLGRGEPPSAEGRAWPPEPRADGRAFSPIPWGALQLPTLGVGLDPAEVDHITRGAGLSLVARPFPDGVATGRGLAFLLDYLAELRPTAVVFAGNTVLGYRDLLKETAAGLRSHGLSFGYVEFAKQFGETGLAHQLGGQVVRVHAITETEMIGMEPMTAVDRFVRGVRERNIRLCYVRLFLQGASPPLDRNAEYIGALARRLQATGHAVGDPRPFEPLPVGPLVRLLPMLGVIAGGLLLLLSLARLSGRTVAVLGVLGLLVAVGGTFAAPILTRKLFGLGAALIFPVWALARVRPTLGATPTTLRAALWGVVGPYAACAAVSLCGAALIAGLLSELEFMVHVDQFAGVKVSLWFPLPIVAVVHLAGLYADRQTAREQWRHAWERLNAVLRGAVVYAHVVVIIVVLAAAVLILVRSGNEPGLGVSGIELRFRDALEQLLIARPRQKEFLVGHPLLVLTLGMMALGRVRGVWLGLMAGAIGQTSMVNTFCHIHTPLSMSVLRTFNGLWLGLLLGLLLLGLVSVAWRKAFDATQQTP